MKYRRYQLTKEAAAIVYRDQPWIFRDHLSSAANVFADGDRLRLVDGANKVVGYGTFDAEGAIAIRVVRRGEAAPDAAWLRDTLKTALTKRTGLAGRTDGIRLVNGESDKLPGVVVDRFGDTLVAQSYTRGADALARFAAIALANELRVPNVVVRPALRKKGEPQPAHVLRGTPPELARFREDGIAYAVDLAGGQKSGAYLDLRALRRALATGIATDAAALLAAGPARATSAPAATHSASGATTRGAATRPAAPTETRKQRTVTFSLDKARVLNLFSYTGMLARAAEQAGATHITSVDASERALAFAAAHHVGDAQKHTFVTANIFDWLPALPADQQFELVIVDPPAMTSDKKQVPAVLAGYRKLYAAAAPHVAPGGVLVVACCTSRIERAVFRETTAKMLSGEFERIADLAPEPDHPVAFAQADYLKIELWRRRS